MTDLRFDDVVDSTRMIGPPGKYATATCKTCSERYKVTRDEFEREGWSVLIENSWEPANHLDRHDEPQDVLLFVAKMRAWNCHHEGEEPLDGFPEEPDIGGVNFKRE